MSSSDHGLTLAAFVALAVVVVLLFFATSSHALTYGVGNACADPVTGQGALIREFRAQYPKPATSGGNIGIGAVSFTVGGVVNYQELNPGGTTSNYSLQLPVCSTDRCVPSGLTVAPCPYGYAPYSAGVSGADPLSTMGAAPGVSTWDTQTMLLVLGLFVSGAIGFRTGFRP